jgi:hypothetical protein
MPLRIGAGRAILGLLILGTLGCDGGTPADGARALVPTDHLEKQRLKLAEMRASLKAQPTVKPRPRH